MKAPKAVEKIKENTSVPILKFEILQSDLVNITSENDMLALLEDKAGYPVRIIERLYNPQTGGTMYTVVQI